MSKVRFEELESGTYLARKKDGAKFLVEDVMDDIKKALVLDVGKQEEKELSASTLERFYTMAENGEAVAEDSSVVEETKSPAGPKVRKPARKVPRPKVSPAEAVVEKKEDTKEEADEKEVDFVEEEIPEETAKEVDPGPKEAAANKPTKLKSDTVLSLSSQLQETISKEFPDVVRVVTETYIGYRRKYVFVEVFEMKRTLYINVRTDTMNKDQLEMLTKKYPKSYGWVLDGKFTIKSEEDIEKAINLIQMSYHSISLK